MGSTDRNSCRPTSAPGSPRRSTSWATCAASPRASCGPAAAGSSGWWDWTWGTRSSPTWRAALSGRTGAEAALAEAGLPASALTVLEVEQMTVSSGRDAGSRVLGLGQRPTAVFCVNDLVALGVLQAMFTAGVRVPEDMSIVGYDDIEFAAAAAVPLTSVRQPAVRMGQTAAELLIEETGDGRAGHRHRPVIFQPELVVRGSTLAQRG